MLFEKFKNIDYLKQRQNYYGLRQISNEFSDERESEIAFRGCNILEDKGTHQGDVKNTEREGKEGIKKFSENQINDNKYPAEEIFTRIPHALQKINLRKNNLTNDFNEMLSTSLMKYQKLKNI